jgi:hypothetical protein
MSMFWYRIEKDISIYKIYITSAGSILDGMKEMPGPLHSLIHSTISWTHINAIKCQTFI